MWGIWDVWWECYAGVMDAYILLCCVLMWVFLHNNMCLFDLLLKLIHFLKVADVAFESLLLWGIFRVNSKQIYFFILSMNKTMMTHLYMTFLACFWTCHTFSLQTSGWIISVIDINAGKEICICQLTSVTAMMTQYLLTILFPFSQKSPNCFSLISYLQRSCWMIFVIVSDLVNRYVLVMLHHYHCLKAHICYDILSKQEVCDFWRHLSVRQEIFPP